MDLSWNQKKNYFAKLVFPLVFVFSEQACTSQSQRQSQSYITTDVQLASLSWCQAPIWDSRPIFSPFFNCL
jgi:hypothetical protein